MDLNEVTVEVDQTETDAAYSRNTYIYIYNHLIELIYLSNECWLFYQLLND